MELYSKPPKKNYPTNKKLHNHLDEIWSIDLADMIDYKILTKEGLRCIFVSSQKIYGVFISKKSSQTVTQEFLKFLTPSKLRPSKTESDRGKELYNNMFQNFLKSKNFQHFSRFTDKGTSIAERVPRNVRNLVKKPIFAKGNSDWLSEIPSVIKQFSNTTHSSTKMEPIQASKNINEKIVYKTLKNNRKVQKPKVKLGQIVPTADEKRVFSKGDSTIYSFELYTEIKHSWYSP